MVGARQLATLFPSYITSMREVHTTFVKFGVRVIETAH